MPLSSDTQLALCLALFEHLASPRVDELLAGCLSGMRAEMEAAGYTVSPDEMALPGMAAGSFSQVRRTACVEVRPSAEAATASPFCLTARLVVDVASTGDSPETLTLQMTVEHASGAHYLTGPFKRVPLNLTAVDARAAQILLTGGLNRLYGGRAVEASHGAMLGSDFCKQLNEALAP